MQNILWDEILRENYLCNYKKIIKLDYISSFEKNQSTSIENFGNWFVISGRRFCKSNTHKEVEANRRNWKERKAVLKWIIYSIGLVQK